VILGKEARYTLMSLLKINLRGTLSKPNLGEWPREIYYLEGALNLTWDAGKSLVKLSKDAEWSLGNLFFLKMQRAAS